MKQNISTLEPGDVIYVIPHPDVESFPVYDLEVDLSYRETSAFYTFISDHSDVLAVLSSKGMHLIPVRSTKISVLW